MGKIVTKSVDMNANILYLKHEIVADTSKTQARIEFRNMAYGTITAVKFEAKGYNAFSDVIQIAGKPTFDIVAQDLNIAPKKYAKLDSVLPSKDIRKLDLKLKQVCYANGKIVNVQPEEIVTYEIEELDGAKGQLEYEAKNILEKKTVEAKCFPKRYGRDWICICGYLNKNTDAICKKCGCKQVDVFETCTEEAVEETLRMQREQKKIEQEKEQARLNAELVHWEEKQRKQIEYERKAKERTFLILGGGIIAFCLVVIVGMLIYRGRYGLSKEDQRKYEIAQQNYDDLKSFYLSLNWNYSESDEMKDVYLECSELYNLLINKYPDKYRELYKNIAYLQKKRIIVENVFEEDIDDEMAIEDEIRRLEKYLNRDALNVDKIEYKETPNISIDSYSTKHKMGIVFFDDGQIRYIGEYENDLANGYGVLWEETENGRDIKYEGQFVDGKIASND